MPSGTLGVLEVLKSLKQGLAYDFRYQTDLNSNGNPKKHTVGHVDHRNAPDIALPDEPLPTVRSVLQAVLTALPEGWRATVFPGRVILYQENQTYRYALEYLQR
jgi:hypothetical protein